ncbi:zeta toxin family protein [Nocardia yamanashiensis]|uniref:zeta toxin family protein n=1 Tax=Nocardia yamanashiensis TaxID=209247 RepID=UPI00082D7A68|nr:zeta toxin family protein [Nocardia yamanashiensis]
MTSSEAEQYRLSETENERIFQQRIVPQLLSGRASHDRPTVVFLTGQPGAGKNRVSMMLAEILNTRGGFVDVDSDLYKPYHPQYDELLARDDTLMAAYTRADGRAWMAKAHQYARDNKINAVIQETSQNADAVADTMREYRQAGFRVEAMILGVSQAMSNQGILNRYYEQVADGGRGRLTVQANADQSYEGIAALADRIDNDRLTDQVAVFRRGEDSPRYLNALDDRGQWESPPATRAALETERQRPWAGPEAADFLAVQHKLRDAIDHGSVLRADVLPEFSARLDMIDHQAAPMLTTSRPGSRGTQPESSDPTVEAILTDLAAEKPALNPESSPGTAESAADRAARIAGRAFGGSAHNAIGPSQSSGPGPAPGNRGPSQSPTRDR